jgi:hypothetical protein
MKAADDGFALYGRLSDTFQHMEHRVPWVVRVKEGWALRCNMNTPPCAFHDAFCWHPEEGLGGFHNRNGRVRILKRQELGGFHNRNGRARILKPQEQCPVWSDSATATPASYPLTLFPFVVTSSFCCTARGRLLGCHSQREVINCHRPYSLTEPRTGFI